jgi:NAD(P)-dependent dehydrogenase (short-subunit alcohol dehydrogenase family)
MWYPIDYKSYDSSKAAVNMLAVNYARILEGKGLVNVVCPGLVKTNLTKFMMGEEPEVAAQRVVEMAVLDKHGPTATYSNLAGTVPW